MQNCKPDLTPNWENAPAGLRVIRYPDGRIAVGDGAVTLDLSAEQARALAQILASDTAHRLAQALAEFTATTVLVQAQLAPEYATTRDFIASL